MQKFEHNNNIILRRNIKKVTNIDQHKMHGQGGGRTGKANKQIEKFIICPF